MIASFLQDDNFIYVLYIIAFALFIYGLSGLTGPSTAVRGPRSIRSPTMNIENATM